MQDTGPVHVRVTSIATGASLNTRPDVPPAGGTSTTTQSLNAPSRHSNCCAHTHSACCLSWLLERSGQCCAEDALIGDGLAVRLRISGQIRA